MMKKQNLIRVIAMLFLFGLQGYAQKVNTDYDRSANFTQYKTYSWGKINAQDPLWADRIKGAVDSSLKAKGWTEVPSGGDISLVSSEATKDQHTLNTFYNGFGGGWRWRGLGSSATTTVDTYKVGTLVVDMFDTRNKELVWRGSASDTLSDKSDNNIKKLDKAVGKMFKKFPPATSKNS
jgi:hypothetical protein